MKNNKHITQGGLSEKMASFTPEPPEVIWENIADQVGAKRSRKGFIYFFAVAAGILFAATVGMKLLFDVSLPSGVATETRSSANQLSNELNDASREITGNQEQEQTEFINNKDKEEQLAATKKVEQRKNQKLEERVLALMEEVSGEEIQIAATDLSRESEQELNREENISLQKQDATELSRDEKENESGNTGPTNASNEISDSGNQQDNSDNNAVLNGEENQLLVEKINEDSLLKLLNPALPEEEIEPGETKNPGKWLMGASLSPVVSYRDAASPSIEQNLAVNSSESAKLTYAGGFSFAYQQSDRLTIESGVYYSKMGVNIGEYSSFKSISWTSPMDYAEETVNSSNVVSVANSMGRIVSSNDDLFVNSYADNAGVTDYHTLQEARMELSESDVDGFTQTLDYLEIPLNFKYNVIDKEVKVQLIGGLSTNILVNNKISAATSDGFQQIGEVADLRSVNYAGNAGIGFVYELTDNLNLNLEPRFRYYLHSVNLDFLPVTRPYSFGFYTGLNYSF